MLQKKFVRSQEPIIASFNFSDVAEGTGIITYNGAILEISGSKTYSMLPFSEYSGDIEINETTATTYTYNYDLGAFNKAHTLKGTAYFSAGVWLTNSADT